MVGLISFSLGILSLAISEAFTAGGFRLAHHGGSPMCQPARMFPEDASAGPEESQMKNYIADFLDRTRDPDERPSIDFSGDNIKKMATHLIAVPLEECHELMIELESVQRAILYHCPILADACIVPSMTRMPLIYVYSDKDRGRVTQQLSRVVEKMVKKHMFDNAQESEEDEDYDINRFDGVYNDEGIRPMTMAFSTLEIEGPHNNVLHTVGEPGQHGTLRMQNFVSELMEKIEEKGYLTALPLDPNNQNTTEFRPRIPFMELPREFATNLEKLNAGELEMDDATVDAFAPDHGGNGISPIFWSKWWDDVFGRRVRLGEVSIYPRVLSEDSITLDTEIFHLPHETVFLPDGSSAMQANEEKFKKYQDDRIKEMLRQTMEGDMESKNDEENPDLLLRKTRDRLEALYTNSPGADTQTLPKLDGDDGVNVKDPDDEEDLVEEDFLSPRRTSSSNDYMEDWMRDRISTKTTASPDNATSPSNNTAATTDSDKSPLVPTNSTDSGEDFMSDWMKERIRKTIEAREYMRAQTPVKKEKPPVEDNLLLQKYREGLLREERSKSRKKKRKTLPPYPSRQHFLGFWRVLESPTGFRPEETTSDRSDNFIFRVDGTVSGGPILDPETGQKAAGGTWRMNLDENNRPRLHIRLMIPPKKDQIIDMEGGVIRMTSSDNSFLASRTFGIPQVEQKLEEANSEDEDIINCEGAVVIEDVATKHREEVGQFSIMKMIGLHDRNDFVITIPTPVRNQD